MLKNCAYFCKKKKEKCICIYVSLLKNTQLPGGSGPVCVWKCGSMTTRQSGIRQATPCRMHPFTCLFRGRHLLDPASESKAKRWQNWHTAGILNGALCRWRRTAAAKRIKLGLQRTLRSPSPRHRSAARPASAARQDRDIFPADLLSRVWQRPLWTLASDATHFIKRGSGGRAEGGGEAKIRVRIITTGSSWGEKREQAATTAGGKSREKWVTTHTRGHTVELTAMTPLFSHWQRNRDVDARRSAPQSEESASLLKTAEVITFAERLTLPTDLCLLWECFRFDTKES